MLLIDYQSTRRVYSVEYGKVDEEERVNRSKFLVLLVKKWTFTCGIICEN